MNWELALSITIVAVCFMAVRHDIQQLKPKARPSNKKVIKDEVQDGPQYVYVLSNPSHRDGLFKIGLTTKDINKRKSQLYTTGVPSPFNTVMVIETDDCKQLENHLHDHFSKKRWNNRREFFMLSSSDLIWIRDTCNPVHVDVHEAVRALGTSESSYTALRDTLKQ